jgi:hypothetical protein
VAEFARILPAGPIVLVISRRQVEEADVASVLSNLKVMTASREEVARYRGQMMLVVHGYNSDKRELLDIIEVRELLIAVYNTWPFFGYYFNLVDESIKPLASATCGKAYPGQGQVEIDLDKLREFLLRGTNGIVTMFEHYGFPGEELDTTLEGFAEYIRDLVS